MNKYEYKIVQMDEHEYAMIKRTISVDDDVRAGELFLNSFGEEGWWLVSRNFVTTVPVLHHFIFARQI